MENKQKEIKEKNKMIAEFMGLIRSDEPVGGLGHEKYWWFYKRPFLWDERCCSDDELSYHRSWDCLIPVARECYKKSLHQGWAKVNCLDYCLNARDFLYEPEIAFETVYREVTSWIEWYNNFKLQEEKEIKKTCMDEVGIMMGTPMNKLPKPAQEYLRHFSNKVGFCGEVCVTAYAAYCQAVLGLPCDDEGYKISPDALQWFKDNKYC